MKDVVLILLLILLFVAGYALMGRMDRFLYLNSLLPGVRERKDQPAHKGKKEEREEKKKENNPAECLEKRKASLLMKYL